MHDIYACFPMQTPTYNALTCLSVQFRHAIHTPISHPLKFNAVVELVAIN